MLNSWNKCIYTVYVYGDIEIAFLGDDRSRFGMSRAEADGGICFIVMYRV